MNDVQTRIAELEAKGWSLAAIADALHIAHNTVESWKAGGRQTHFEKLVLDALDQLLIRKRIPPKRRSIKGKHRQRNTSRNVRKM
jgi:transcriptional regulator with XRE-family HTH domain